MRQSVSPLLPAIRVWARRHQQGLAASLFLLPGLIMFTVYVIAPIIESIGLSFYSWDGLGAAKYIGLENYVNLFSDEAFYTALKNNIIWLFCYLLSVPAGLAIALLLNQTSKGIRFIKSVFFFPFVISQVVIGVIFTLFYDPSLGLFVKLLHFFDIKPIAVLSSAHWVTYGIIVAGLYPQIAYCMILYLTGLNNLRPDLIEAARLEGAHGWKMLFKIVLPQLRAATFIAVVVTVIGSLRSFDMISIMTQGGPYGSSATLAYYMYEVALSEYGFRMGYGAAVATVLFLIMLVFIVFILHRVYMQERETS
ncbi:MAG: sugar ABC transporter permease [Betaproteobacteria bacterium]|nr:sugar ABC transporter permease [Betaproteobacteria bacterium]MDE2124214.1 sugar ABC transporter permease [Betaproteobacteria bacterium]MDE2187799.1 sugar ABC transporter permease [Betaproteobacteria bacterium]MDE2323254.1 sugar ABC transporter permease [Betaproteobacteria bacterium]